MRDRTTRLDRQPHTAINQLLGVFPRTWHRTGTSFLEAENLVSKSPSIPGQLIIGTRFNAGASFAEVSFSGTLRCDGATFSGPAYFAGLSFSGGANFQEATFAGDVTFGDAIYNGATFAGDVNFRKTTFKGRAEFAGATFENGAAFVGAIFENGGVFTEAAFQGNANFNNSIFHGDADFSAASLKEATSFGPVFVLGELTFDRASIGRCEIEVSAARLSYHRTHFGDAANAFVRCADVVLDGATFERAAVLAGSPDLGFASLERQLPPRATDTPSDRFRVVSMRLLSVENLALSDADLRACRFAGARNLDRLRAERCTFAKTPRKQWRWNRWRLPWWWTRRETLAEEQQWRAAVTRRGKGRWTGWYGAECRPPLWLDYSRFLKLEQLEPAEIASIYRALRKGREDSKDEPGANDFYYGETEMRRRHGPRGQRWILSLYWLVSGYGLRASRALLALVVTVAGLGAIPLALWGFRHHHAYGPALLFALQSSISLLRATPSPPGPQTAAGQLIEIFLRLAGPLFFGLALLALRGRIKR